MLGDMLRKKNDKMKLNANYHTKSPPVNGTTMSGTCDDLLKFIKKRISQVEIKSQKMMIIIRRMGFLSICKILHQNIINA